ncbi:MAG: hypothetical protein IJG13_11795 [Kiritimatiellae bacterium]|nr:hypothetical protein [Kiritimatiellia bacterium]
MKHAVATLAAVVGLTALADGGATWYLVDSDDSKFLRKSCVNAYWRSEDGTTAGERAGEDGTALSSTDFFVVRNKRNLRSYGEEGGGDRTPTVFTCKRLTFGEDGRNNYGGFLCYCKDVAYVDFGSGADQDGAFFYNGYVMGYKNFGCSAKSGTECRAA